MRIARSHASTGARPALALLLTLVALPASAQDVAPDRRTTTRDLDVRVHKRVLPNGLVVLMAPDSSASRVLVDLCFRAGARYEPSDKTGLAHLVEHLLFRGPTPDTDYYARLQEERATGTNAYTNSDTLCFRTLVPGSGLQAALEANAGRMATLPALIDEARLQRERGVVAVERVERMVDVPYASAERSIAQRLFPPPDPLHGQVVGVPKELAAVSLADVRAFIQRLIVPANAVLTLVGGLDPKTTPGLVQRCLGGLPPGQKATVPERPWREVDSVSVELPEQRSRRPRVSVLWKLDGLSRDAADALEFGAQALGNSVDGAFGSEVDAMFLDDGERGVFRLDVTLPYEKPVDSAAAEAEVFLRFLTGKDLPRDTFDATRLARDRDIMFALDSLEGRAGLLTSLELRFGDPTGAGRFNERHWRFARHDIQHVAWKTLVVGRARMLVHARPVRPAQPKVDWEVRQ